MVATARTTDPPDIGLAELGSPFDLKVGSHTQASGEPRALDGRELHVVDFTERDPRNPVNFSQAWKIYIVIAGLFIVANSTLSSSLPSGAVSYIAKDLRVTNKIELALPVSLFLIGYVVGPPVFSPLSEAYGRKWVLLGTFIPFMLSKVGSGATSTWSVLLFCRTIEGICASCPLTVVSGLYADIYPDPEARGRALTLNLIVTTFGPVLAPSISGFVAPISWRWTFWISLMFAGVTLPMIVFLPETYRPVILQRLAKEADRSIGDIKEVITSDELKQRSRPVASVSLSAIWRPLRLFVEPLIFVSCTFLAFEYAIFYLFFEAYPIIFRGLYGMSAGISGLMFIPLGIGTTLAGVSFIYYDRFLLRAKARGAAWSQNEEFRRLPLACVGGPLCVGALFWLGWSARPNVNWAVPMLAGLFYGLGIEMTFIALLNYIADAYAEWTASAMACSAISRSAFAVALPLATDPMFDKLGIAWALSLLGFICAVMCIGPFGFVRYGGLLRQRSRFCKHPDHTQSSKQSSG